MELFSDPDQVMMPARFRVERSWGNVRAYPDCDYSVHLMRLAGSKTLVPRHITNITALGFVCIDQNNKVIDWRDLA